MRMCAARCSADTLSLWDFGPASTGESVRGSHGPPRALRRGGEGVRGSEAGGLSSAPHAPLLYVGRTQLLGEGAGRERKTERAGGGRGVPSGEGRDREREREREREGERESEPPAPCTLSFSGDGALIAWCVEGEEDVVIVPTTPCTPPAAAPSAESSSSSTPTTVSVSGEAEGGETRDEETLARRRMEEEEGDLLSSVPGVPACLTRALQTLPAAGRQHSAGGGHERGAGGEGGVRWKMHRQRAWGAGGEGGAGASETRAPPHERGGVGDTGRSSTDVSAAAAAAGGGRGGGAGAASGTVDTRSGGQEGSSAMFPTVMEALVVSFDKRVRGVSFGSCRRQVRHDLLLRQKRPNTISIPHVCHSQ